MNLKSDGMRARPFLDTFDVNNITIEIISISFFKIFYAKLFSNRPRSALPGSFFFF